MKTRIYSTLNGLWVSKLGRATLITALLLSVGVITVLAADNFVGGWNIDGIVPDCNPEAEGCDIEVFSDLFGSVDELGPVNSNETKLGVIHTAPLPMLSYTNPNAQVDLRAAWLGTKEDANKDLWLYFAWERDSTNGSGVIMFEFQQSEPPSACDYTDDPVDLIAACNPWENRQPDDFIIVWDQVGKKPSLILRTWEYVDSDLDGEWDGPVAEPLALDVGVTLNETVSYAVYGIDKHYGEASINLSDTIFEAEPTKCTTIGNVIPGTVTGNSDTADYKDTILADFSGKIQISNCGSIKVIKETDPDALSGTFPYTIDQADDGAIRYSGDNLYTQTGTLTEDGDFDTWNDLKCDTDYQLVEGGVGPAFAMTSIVCKVNGDTVNITSGGTFSVRASKTTECTITNEQQKGQLIVKKVVVNDDGGTKVATDFSFTVNAGDAVAFITDPDQDPLNYLLGKNTVSNLTTGDYDVVEPAVAGYTTTYSDGTNPDCDDVNVPAGGSAICTITNNDIAPTLKLVKSVTNNDGGNEEPEDWTLTAKAEDTDFNDRDYSHPGNYSLFEPVFANTVYILDESDIAGYTPGTWTCNKDVTVTDGKITLPAGKTEVTCTITNNDIAPTLKLVKSVTNDNGGTNQPVDWTMTATSTAGRNYSHPGNYASFQAVYANAEYTLGESGPSSPTAIYTPGTWSCNKGVAVTGGKIILTEGQTEVTCTIVNDDTKAEPTGATTMSWKIADTLTISGIRAGATGANVDFYVYSDDTCSTLVGSTMDASIASGVANSAYFTVGVGTYYWQAVYSGDQYNVGFTTKCGYEITTIGQTIGSDWK